MHVQGCQVEESDSIKLRLDKCNRRGYSIINRWSVKVSGNWRVTFRFEKGNGYEIDYGDYY